MYIETPLTPRFCDSDAAGHINNTATTQWLEAGRFDFALNHLDMAANMLLRRVEVDYDRELSFRENAVIRTGVERIGGKSLTLRQEIWQGGVCCVRALAVECYIDKEARRPADIPEHLREIYRKYLFAENQD